MFFVVACGCQQGKRVPVWSDSANNELLLPLPLALSQFVLNIKTAVLCSRGSAASRCRNICAHLLVCHLPHPLSRSASLAATLCYCHRPVVSPRAGEDLVPVFAERRVTSGEWSELVFQEAPSTLPAILLLLFLAGCNVCLILL